MKLSIFAALGALVIVIGALFWRHTSSSLHIHLQAISGASVTVESANLAERLQFSPSTSESLISPLAHGVYRIGLHLPDGRTIWTAYLHHDAGVRRRTDLFISFSTRPGYVRFHQTANDSEELFSGETRPEDTTEEKPFHLNWI